MVSQSWKINRAKLLAFILDNIEDLDTIETQIEIGKDEILSPEYPSIRTFAQNNTKTITILINGGARSGIRMAEK